MASLEIAYYCKAPNQNMPGDGISAETIATLSATNQRSGATPAHADYVKISANGGAARYSYTSATSTASATTPWLGSGEAIWLPAHAGWKVGGITG